MPSMPFASICLSGLAPARPTIPTQCFPPERFTTPHPSQYKENIPHDPRQAFAKPDFSR
jgi:hypothetical protein